ncbi:enoyl-CoA hydratase/isomerase family protein [Nocardia sp. NPDC056064]|uniref:enoyl-CoA hydratase/isomerase family protein n=1 Tax=Nocardia sp. NPDC056064 TaxID=3345701 RepID=UPI0035DA7BB2
MAFVEIEDFDRVRVLTLAHAKPTNPIGKPMAEAIMAALREADADQGVDAVVVTGGPDRSFSAGGDFNEARLLEDDDLVNETIDWCHDLYLTVLNTGKPTVAAIDHHAVGLGCQLAMMFDWKIMTSRADFWQPELQHGIGASVGSTIFAAAVGYDVSRHIIMSCRKLDADTSLSLRVVDEICEPEVLLERAVQQAEHLGGYPRIAFTATKRVLTEHMRGALERTREESKAVHRASFGAKAMHSHFDNVLGTGAAR